MITKHQAVNMPSRAEIHYGTCSLNIGSRGGRRFSIERWRPNGICKLWPTRPDDFSLPIKTGFYGPFDYVTNRNAEHFHLAEDCPIQPCGGCGRYTKYGEPHFETCPENKAP